MKQAHTTENISHMQTECPHCNTVFYVKESDLEQADSQVRCGHCLAIFSADNPYNSISLQTDSKIKEPEEAETHIVADVIPPQLRAETHKDKIRFAFVGSLFLSLGILGSIAAGVLQYAYYNRDNLIKIEELRPWLVILCEQTGCTLPPPKDIKLITLSSKNIFTHPNVSNALMVSASIVNQADFAQDYPVIELRFENIRGQTIAGRRFYAVEYLGIPEDQISKMQPDAPVNINLEIKDPGDDMVSYEFSFL